MDQSEPLQSKAWIIFEKEKTWKNMARHEWAGLAPSSLFLVLLLSSPTLFFSLLAIYRRPWTVYSCTRLQTYYKLSKRNCSQTSLVFPRVYFVRNPRHFKNAGPRSPKSTILPRGARLPVSSFTSFRYEVSRYLS